LDGFALTCLPLLSPASVTYTPPIGYRFSSVQSSRVSLHSSHVDDLNLVQHSGTMLWKNTSRYTHRQFNADTVALY
jgi:hypothetical protein